MILLDGRGGSSIPGKIGSSAQLALHEPVRSLLPPCPRCGGAGRYKAFSAGTVFEEQCPTCAGTGRQLTRITTRLSSSGPDVLFAGNGPSSPLTIAVEVKSLAELINAGDTGRLAGFDGQLPAMLAEGYDVCWVLYYGISKCGDPEADGRRMLKVPRGRGEWATFMVGNGREVTYGYLHGMLIEIAAMGVHTRGVRDIKEAAAWIGALYRWWQKPWADHDFTKKFDRSRRFPVQPLDSPELVAVADMLSRIPAKIGYEKARAAAIYFGSMLAAAGAGEDAWRAVPGIGKTLAAAAYRYFRQQVPEAETQKIEREGARP